ncbi:hypothetical protein MOQ_002860 [Trypanosoma cruzi marinkellei]|uniref:Uncharacterized protein n=1 Tax=Trypanosoma cruzi marinkellei TaxID=85056 RepID=K2N5K7_TRYCR|nr:hypothetical protein MOQ_002860 [Trypanosoma cruzi marinkellei]
MFRYHLELLGCEWSSGQPLEVISAACFEVHCRRRGARCRVSHFPAEFTVRSAPETDTLFLSVLCGETVLASSDVIDIGGVSRRVGVRTVALKAGEEVVCKVRFMWCVEAEDGTVFSRCVEDYAEGERSTAVAVEKHVPSTHPEGPPVVERMPSTEKTCVVSGATPISFEVLEPTAKSHHPTQDVVTGQRTFLPPGPQEKGAEWSVGSPQYAPKGILDYHVTSTQVINQPRAWRNLYTSSAPLLAASGLIRDETESTATSQCEKHYGNSSSFSIQRGLSLEDIRLHPTKAPEATDADFRRDLYRKKMNVKWRGFISPSHASIRTTTYESL